MRDLRDFYNPHLTATINGQTFTVECPSAAEGLRLRMWATQPDRVTIGADLIEINKLFRGDPLDPEGQPEVPTGGLWDELWDAGVTWDEAFHLGVTAFMYFSHGEDVAMAHWESAGESPKAETPTTTPKAKRKTNPRP